MDYPACHVCLPGGTKQRLVGGLEHFLLPHILRIVILADFHIFQRGKLNHQPEEPGSEDSIAFFYLARRNSARAI